MHANRIDGPALLDMARRARATAATNKRQARLLSHQAGEIAALAGETLHRVRVDRWDAAAAAAPKQ